MDSDSDSDSDSTKVGFGFGKVGFGFGFDSTEKPDSVDPLTRIPDRDPYPGRSLHASQAGACRHWGKWGTCPPPQRLEGEAIPPPIESQKSEKLREK